MKYSKKQYNYYSDDERMSYIREYYQVPRANLSFVSVTAFVPSFLLIGLTSIK